MKGRQGRFFTARRSLHEAASALLAAFPRQHLPPRGSRRSIGTPFREALVSCCCPSFLLTIYPVGWYIFSTFPRLCQSPGENFSACIPPCAPPASRCRRFWASSGQPFGVCPIPRRTMDASGFLRAGESSLAVIHNVF